MKSGKIALFCVIMVIFAGSAVFSQEDGTPAPPDASLSALKKSVDDFATNLAYSLPFNSSLGLHWSSAYIGDFPKFGVGISFGFTTMDTSSFEAVFKQFDRTLPDLSGFGGFPIPGWTVEGRIGGFIPKVPFDIGLKFGILPLKELSPELKQFDYLMIGGDIRYAIMKEFLVFPAVSVGIGFNYLSGAMGVSAGNDKTFSFQDPGSKENYTLELGAPAILLPWETASLDFKAQISKNFGVVTPYLGIGASTGWSTAGYEVSTKVKAKKGDQDVDLSEVKDILTNAFGIEDLSTTGFGATTKINKWSGRLFGGLSFNMALFKLDLTAFWNFYDNRYGVSIGARIQT
jgi:hypothetical protein